MRYIFSIAILIILLCAACAKSPSPNQISTVDADIESSDDTVASVTSTGETEEIPFDPTEGLENGVAEAGREYFDGENRGRCLVCHTLNGEGFEDGWALDDTGLRRGPEWLARWIDNPRNLRPEVVIMPPWRGDSEGATIADVVAFLMTLQTEVEHPETTDIKPADEPEPNHNGIAGSEGSHTGF